MKTCNSPITNNIITLFKRGVYEHFLKGFNCIQSFIKRKHQRNKLINPQLLHSTNYKHSSR